MRVYTVRKNPKMSIPHMYRTLNNAFRLYYKKWNVSSHTTLLLCAADKALVPRKNKINFSVKLNSFISVASLKIFQSNRM